MAKLYFRYGAMGSSKSANILMVRYNYEERGQYAILLKPRPPVSRFQATDGNSRCYRRSSHCLLVREACTVQYPIFQRKDCAGRCPDHVGIK